MSNVTLRTVSADDHAAWLPEGVHLWRISRGPLLARLALATRLVAGNALALLRKR